MIPLSIKKDAASYSAKKEKMNKKSLLDVRQTLPPPPPGDVINSVAVRDPFAAAAALEWGGMMTD